MSLNGISTHSPKSAREGLKLDLAAAKRATIDDPGYRPYNIHDGSPSVAPTVGRPFNLDPDYYAALGGLGATASFLNRAPVRSTSITATAGFVTVSIT